MKVLSLLRYATVLALGGTLAFGTEVSFERDGSLPIVDVNVAFRAGSVTDPAGQGGITNFMAQMLMRGTRKRTKEQIDLALDDMGASLGVETRAESLILRGSVLKSQLEPFLALMGEIITEPSFPEREIKKLKSEITSELLDELGHDPTLASRRFTRFLFGKHPFGNPISGTPKEVEAMTRARISAHYSKIFRSKYLVVVGTGDSSQERISAWANALKLPSGGTGVSESTEMVKLEVPRDSPARRLLIIDKPDLTQTQIHIGQIGTTFKDADFFPLYLANHVFGGGSFNARLMVEVRVKRGWSYGAYSNFRFGTVPRSWTIYFFPAVKDSAPALDLALQMLRDFQSKGITQEEFEFAKTTLTNSAGFAYDTPKKRVENKLLERTLDLPDGFMKSYAENIAKLELATVNAAVRRFLHPDHVSISVLATAKDSKEALAKAAGVPETQVQVLPYTQELDEKPARKH